MKDNKTLNDLGDVMCSVWGERVKNYLLQPPMYISKKYKNRKWKWWKVFTPRYKYKFVFNKEWNKYK